MKGTEIECGAELPPALKLLTAGVAFAVAAGTKPAPQGGAVEPPHEQDTIDELKTRMVETYEQGEAIRATADAEKRMLADAEQQRLDELDGTFAALDQEVKRRERLAAQRERLAKPEPRITKPADPAGTERQRITGGEAVGATKGSWGWRSLGEFARGVFNARSRNQVDQRLQAAASTYSNEDAGADGGFAVPPDFRENIVKKVQAEDGLLARTDQQTTSSNKMTVPLDETTPWQSAGGILCEWEGEGSTGTPSKLKAGQLEIKAHKLKALVPVTDELLEDAPSLSRYLPGKVADKFTSKLNTAIVNGNGVGKPQGLLNSGSKITVNKEASQTAATVVFNNIVKMWARLYAPLRTGAVWLINQDIEPQLMGMVVPGTQPSFPAYLPPGGLSGAPYGQLLGRPVIAVEACKQLGTEGDIILVNLMQYLSVMKVGGLRQDVSIHLYFDQDLTAFRFILRAGGQSWWPSAASPENGTNTRSNIVTLETRS